MFVGPNVSTILMIIITNIFITIITTIIIITNNYYSSLSSIIVIFAIPVCRLANLMHTVRDNTAAEKTSACVCARALYGGYQLTLIRSAPVGEGVGCCCCCCCCWSTRNTLVVGDVQPKLTFLVMRRWNTDVINLHWLQCTIRPTLRCYY